MRKESLSPSNLLHVYSTWLTVCSPRPQSHSPDPIPGTFFWWRKCLSPILPVLICTINELRALGVPRWSAKTFLLGSGATLKSYRPRSLSRHTSFHSSITVWLMACLSAATRLVRVFSCILYSIVRPSRAAALASLLASSLPGTPWCAGIQ